MYKILFAFSLVLIFSACKPSQVIITPEVYENFIQLTYENVQDNTTHFIEDIEQTHTEMYSLGSYTPSVGFVTQNIRPVYFFGTYPVIEEVPQLLTLNFTHKMPADEVEPVAGQSYGQLYTYIDREKYATDVFAEGRVFNQAEEMYINFQVGSIWSGTGNEGTYPLFELTIDKSVVFENEEGQKSVYVTGHFWAEPFVQSEDAIVPEGTLRYKITEGKFGFVRVIDGI